MNQIVNQKTFVTALVAAALTVCAGVYLSVGIGSDTAATLVVRIFSLIAFAIILKYTLVIGRIRGYPIRKTDGSIHLSNLARNVVAALILFVCVTLIAAPFMPALVKFAK